jgi:predicted regulator of Ras-like GTPase activity (Roadblock/LC7/MglB family)
VAGSRYLGRGAVEMDADLVAAAMARAFGGMNAVFDRFNFPEDELELMSRGFVEVLQQAGMG